MFECVRALTRGCEFDSCASVVSCICSISQREIGHRKNNVLFILN